MTLNTAQYALNAVHCAIWTTHFMRHTYIFLHCPLFLFTQKNICLANWITHFHVTHIKTEWRWCGPVYLTSNIYQLQFKTHIFGSTYFTYLGNPYLTLWFSDHTCIIKCKHAEKERVCHSVYLRVCFKCCMSRRMTRTSRHAARRISYCDRSTETEWSELFQTPLPGRDGWGRGAT